MPNNSIPYYPKNMRYSSYNNYNSYPSYTNYSNSYRNNPNDRFGGFLFPFALGFVSSPLLFGATRPRPYPVYPAPYPYPYPRPYPYY